MGQILGHLALTTRQTLPYWLPTYRYANFQVSAISKTGGCVGVLL